MTSRAPPWRFVVWLKTHLGKNIDRIVTGQQGSDAGKT
jgi:hypothetical protein